MKRGEEAGEERGGLKDLEPTVGLCSVEASKLGGTSQTFTVFLSAAQDEQSQRAGE
jgi:hypothetical protein